MKKAALLLLSLIMLLSCAACSAPEAPAPAQSAPEGVSFTDDLGREVTVTSCNRVAALIGSFADVWCLAGGKDTLVAAANDAWTSFDLNLSDEVVDLGAIKSPNLEALLAAQPDLVIGSCNTQADIDLEPTLTAAGITVAYFDVQSFADYLNMLSVCTMLTGKPELYERYGAALQERIDAAIARQDGSSPTVLCVRATGTSVKVRGSRDNLLGEMAAELGCVNVADSETSLLDNLSMEAIIRAQPDYIFVVVQGADPTEAETLLESTLLSNPAWSTLTAVREGRYHVLDNALYNLKPNARWGEAYEELSQILYP